MLLRACFDPSPMEQHPKLEGAHVLRIDYEMSEQNITQQKLGDTVGCHRVVIGRYVSGKDRPCKKRAEAIADALGWPQERADELFEPIEVEVP